MRVRNGFTLIELMISMAVATLLLAAVYLAVNSTQLHTSAIERKVTAQQDIKSAMELMAIEISMASYNPMFASSMWEDTNCGASPNPEYKGIQEATNTSLTIEMDLNSNGTVNDPNEVIRYNYVTTGADRYITRTTRCGTVQYFLGDTIAGGRPRTVRVINNELGLLVFRYFDGTGAEIPVAANGLPLRIPEIRRIVITLAVETENPDPNTGQRKRLIYSTSVIPRNHVSSGQNVY
jgi:prepilin-type N-terminal cleavage/methylation domain-containing protein